MLRSDCCAVTVPSVSAPIPKVVPLGGLNAEACLDLARALEASSRHPVARAFAGESATEAQAPRDFPGQGIEAVVAGRRVRIGTARFCGDICLSLPGADGSPVYLADESGWLAAFELADSPRTGLPEFVSGLKALSLKVHLASGDRPEVVGALPYAHPNASFRRALLRLEMQSEGDVGGHP